MGKTNLELGITTIRDIKNCKNLVEEKSKEDVKKPKEDVKKPEVQKDKSKGFFK